MRKFQRLVVGVTLAAFFGIALPHDAVALTPGHASSSGGSGVVDTIKGWFGGGHHDAKPPVGGKLAIPSREKLPKGRKLAAAHRVKELTGRRTAHSRFWQMSDGRIQAELSADATSYRAGRTWKPIDTRLRTTHRSGYALANTTNTASSYFGTRPGKLIRFETPSGQAVTLGLDGSHGTLRPAAKGSKITYSGAVDGGDLSYQVGPGRVKEAITLHRAPHHPLSFAFTLDTGGLTPKQRKDGSIGLYGENPGTPVMVIPAAFMTDQHSSASSPYGHAYSTKVTQILAKDGKDWRLKLTPDAKWLASPKRAYPVVIDPTITITPQPGATQDTMVLSDQPTTNFNTAWNLSVGRTATGTARSLIKFPLDDIPSGVKIDTARLSMYYDQAHDTGDTDVTVKAHRATGAWDASTATWEKTAGLVGEESGTTVQQDDGDAGTAAVGEWPGVGTIGGITVGNDYRYNKNAATGESYTWQPTVPERATYQMEVHYPAYSDDTTAAPYTVTYANGTAHFTVDQSAGLNGVWKALSSSQYTFNKGTPGSIKLGDTGDADHRTVADAIRLVNPAQIIKNRGEFSQWHDFPVADTVQKWVDGTAANYGFILTGSDESADGPIGGPRYDAGDGDYGGETSTLPRLTVTYGKVGSILDSPTVVHGTGPELSWSAYANTTGDPGLDFAEYQVHRSTSQTFTPSAATLVAPIDTQTTTDFTDTTATPTPASSTAEIGRSYFYQIVVKTKNGTVIGSPTRLVGVPKAGRTMRLLQTGTDDVADTTLSKAQPDTNLDALPDAESKVGQPWLEVGNDSPTYGVSRAALKFNTSDIPTTATVLQSTMYLWDAQTTQAATGNQYELHGLTRDFDETTATWNQATAGTNWTNAGGDYSATVSDYVPGIATDTGRHYWDATLLTQGWVKTPASNHGALVRMKDETTTGGKEHSVFLSAEASDPQLRPLLRVIYVDATPASTYYAPQVPQRMTPSTTYNVDVTLTNTADTDWTTTGKQLSYHWKLADGSDVTNGGNQIFTALPSDLIPGESATIHAQVKAPTNADSGNPTNARTAYTLTWDIHDTAAKTWLSETGGSAGLAQHVTIEDPTSDTIGLEKFYAYTGKNTGAGSTVMTNLASGNAVWSYNAFANPGRGLGTFARFAYNSLDTSDTVMGPGWSAQASAPVRLGAALDFHPNPNPTEVTLTDGDGTASVFRKQADGSFKPPAGVHYKLAAKTGVECTPDKDDTPDAWSMTKPDGTRFLYDCDGYVTSIVDKNGNTETFTYEARKSNNKPVKFLKYITDPAGRQTLTLSYYEKGQDGFDYVDAIGAVQHDTGKLTNPKIIDHVASMTDISGRTITFTYTVQGLMGHLTDGAGSSNGKPKNFSFAYDATQGTKNVKLVSITDPRANADGKTYATKLAYNEPQEGDNPKYHWWAKTITDRRGFDTTFSYAPDASNSAFTDTEVVDAETHGTSYITDDFARPVQTINAKSQTTKLSWDADNNVTLLEEDNHAKTAFCYDAKTGYPTKQWDAETTKTWTDFTASYYCDPDNASSVPNPTSYTYQTRLDGYAADLFTKTSPEGRTWRFGYDTFGNLTSVTDPKGVASTGTDTDYVTRYGYDGYGELNAATDANQHTTHYSDFDPNGYPQTTTDPLTHASHASYDERGNVLTATDELGHTTSQAYDTFGRPRENKTPKDQANNVYITTPAPTYDANDNVTEALAPNGAKSTAVYDETDEITSATGPDNNTTGRTTTYTYDKTGHLKTTTEPKGNLPDATAGSYTTTNTYNDIYELTDVTNASNDKLSYRYDNVGNVTYVTDPVKNATADTGDFTTKTDYDLDHRPKTVTDAAGNTTLTGYDKDSLTTSQTDADNNTTTVTYDERGKVKQVQTPYQGSAGSPTFRTTKYDYDQVGNTTKVFSPRAVAANSDTAFTARTTYDELNRPKRQYQPYDPADLRYNDANVFTETSYDAAGRVEKVSAPPSQGQSVRNETSYTYWDDGQIHTSTDPWDITTTYDHDELGQQTSRTLTSAGGSSSRTMAWAYWPDGSLKTRADDGIPTGLQVVLADNSDTQNTTATGTWTKTTTGTDHQGYDYATHTAGSGSDSFTWRLNVPQDGTYTAYVRYPKVTGAASSAQYTITHDGTATDKSVDQSANTGSWVSLGSYSFTQGNASTITLAQNGSGTVAADGIKLVRDNTGETNTAHRAFNYSYDVNGNLTKIADSSVAAKIDTYGIDYTGLNQVAKVTESAGGTEKTHTGYTYDPDGQINTVDHPGQYSTYDYNSRELVQTVTVGDSAADQSPKTTGYTYTPRGQKDTETKANKNYVTHTYWPSGQEHTSTEKTSTGVLIDDHTLTWDVNGNKAKDVAKKQNADTHDPAAPLASTTDYTYDPADRLAKAVKTGNGAGTETYVHDDNANVITQTVGGVTTDFSYDRNRLQYSTTAGQQNDYNYDPFGRLDTISAAGQILSHNTYDGFDHITQATNTNTSGSTVTTQYTFDPLDRTTSKTENDKTTNFDYLGLSDEVIDEHVGSQLTKSYQYSPWGQRLSQVTHNSDGSQDLGVYGYNSHEDVETLTDSSGNTKATYGYTAYGDDDTSEFTGIDKPDAGDPTKEAYNPYRYNAKRFDAATGTYDMGFRDYSPGLNRFLTRDMYNGALDDANLATDPLTGNRYSFGGGNPTTNIELDGHCWADRCGGGYTKPGFDTGSKNSTQKVATSSSVYDVTPKQAKALKKVYNYYNKKDHCVNNGKTYICQTQAEVDQDNQRLKQLLSDLGDLTLIVPGIRCTMGNKHECDVYGDIASVMSSLPPGLGVAAAEAKTADNFVEDIGAALESRAASCAVHSFLPDTRVLMADGHTKKIKDVKAGDKVKTTDPKTGKSKIHTVKQLITTRHDKDFVTLTLRTGKHTSKITSTTTHPFWVPSSHIWITALDLKPGMTLHTPTGSTATIQSAHQWHRQHLTNDLTVAVDHTYYVLAGNTPVLVHNCAAPSIRVSPAASDWATKGAHIHVGNSEVRVFPTGDGGIGFEGIRLRNGTASARDVEIARNAVMNDPALRADLIDKARSAMADMNDHNWGNSLNRAPEMNFLIKALGKIE